jgi:internalin A
VRLSSLQKLSLRGTRVTNTGLEHLKGLTSLSVLNLAGTQVTAAGVDELKQALPSLTISH